MTFRIEGVEEEYVLHHHELLADAWKRVYPPHYRLRCALAKAWTCKDMVFAFSAGVVGSLSVCYAIEYDRITNSCEVTFNTGFFGTRTDRDELFAKVLRMALGSSDTNYEDGTH